MKPARHWSTLTTFKSGRPIDKMRYERLVQGGV
jgi:hypothetical protein